MGEYVQNYRDINKMRAAAAMTQINTTGATQPLPPVMGLGKFLSGMPLDQGNPALLRAPTLSASFSTSRLRKDPLLSSICSHYAWDLRNHSLDDRILF